MDRTRSTCLYRMNTDSRGGSRGGGGGGTTGVVVGGGGENEDGGTGTIPEWYMIIIHV